MNLLFQLLEKINPLFFVVIFLLYILMRVIPYIVGIKFSDTKWNVEGYNETIGVIIDYQKNIKQEKFFNEKTKSYELKDVEYLHPIISYEVDNEKYTFIMKKEFNCYFRGDTIGDEVKVFYKVNEPSIAKAKYTDVYASDIKKHTKSLIISSSLVGAFCLIGIILCLVAKYL